MEEEHRAELKTANGPTPEPVEIVDYDPRWPARFAELAARIHAAFRDGPLLVVEHVGSTSVVGLAAKPVIDIDVVIPSRDALPDAVARLALLGYVHQGSLGIPGREAFRSPPGGPRHHLYVCACDCPEYARHIAFREFLRGHTDEAQEYAALKRALAARFRGDRTAYSEGKTAFVQSALARAWE